MSIGLALSQRFFDGVVAPLLAVEMPHLDYAAARLGDGSEVLGFDTEMSADHNYGPTLQLFLAEADFAAASAPLMTLLDRNLPEQIDGWPVRFPSFGRPGADVPGALGSDHGVEVHTLAAWTWRQLGINAHVEAAPADWLGLPEQRLLTVTAGAVFRDDIGELQALRQRLSYLPQDVWLFKLAAQWSRIGEEMAFVGRTGETGDELGSRIIAARLVQDVMRLCFLIERTYAPYAKWFGVGFARLGCAARIAPLLERTVTAETWQPRQQALAEAYELAGKLQIARDVPGAIAPRIQQYFNRPFTVINAGEIAAALRKAIADPTIRALPDCGGIDQFSDSTPVLSRPSSSHRIIRAAIGA